MPVEARLNLRVIIGLDNQYPNGQSTFAFVDELNSCFLVATVINLKDSNPSAIINGCELIQPSLGPRNAFQKLNIHLHPVARLLLLISFPLVVLPFVSPPATR